MAIKCASSGGLARLFDVRADLCNNRSAKGDVWYEMAIPEYSLSANAILKQRRCECGKLNSSFTNMISTCSQSAPCSMVRTQSAPSCAKSAERIDGAMRVLGAMLCRVFEIVQKMLSVLVVSVKYCIAAVCYNFWSSSLVPLG